MNIQFFENHLKTIKDLQNIAEKHNCSIHFGFDSSCSSSIDEDIFKANKIHPIVFDDLTSDDVELKNVNCETSYAWFELYEKDKDKYNVMRYVEKTLYFEIENFNDENVSEEFIDFYNNNQYEDMDFYELRTSPTIITGFGNKEQIKDYRCYRPGMCVKYFADLVCDYLGEERICRTY